MLLAAFVAAFPEFAQTDPLVVQPALDRAARLISAKEWGTFADDGQALLAAHYLAISPFGQGVRLQSKDGSSPYWRQYEELRDTITIGFGVAGTVG